MRSAGIRAMVAKEMHDLFPLIIALIALEILGLIDSFVSRSPDTVTWHDLSVLLSSSLANAAGITYVIVGMITAYVLFAHEGKQQTLQFLWSLPVQRWQIFVAKFATALMVLSAMILIGHLALLWVYSFSVGSISSAQFSWTLWCRELAVLFGATAIGLGYGALVASFRVLGILIFLGVWAAIVVVAYRDSSYQYLNVTTLLSLEFRGSEILLNSKAWKLHSTVASICVFVAAYRWTRDGRPPAQKTRAGRIGTRIALGLGIVTVFSLVVGYGTTQLAPNLINPGVDSTLLDLQRQQTGRYEVSYYLEDEAQAQLLIDQADSYAEQILELLDHTTEELILADLTDSSSDHLGIAGWKKLRMDRTALYDDNLRSHVFVHESAHVVAGAASDRRLAEHNSSAQFFSEGLAEWVAYEIIGLDEQRQALRLLSALAWKRHNLRFEDMVFASAFRRQFDQNLVYALGEAWVSTLANECGEQAPGAALKAMARPGGPQQISGTAFWQDVLQASDCDIGAVNGKFELLMRSYEPLIEKIPELTGEIKEENGFMVFTLTLGAGESDVPYQVFVRLRDDVSASPLSIVTESAFLLPGETITIPMPLRMISGQRFQYQFGVEFLYEERPFFSRWMDGG